MEQELIVDVGSLSNDELFEFERFLQEQSESTLKELAEEIKKFAGDNFDPYSFSGEKKIKKANAKFVDTLGAINFWIEKVESEIEYRKNIGKIKDDSNKEPVSVDEFILTEKQKTETLKKSNK